MTKQQEADVRADYSKSSLFTTLRIGSTELKNRVVFPATVNMLGKNGLVTEDQIKYYERRAIGGAGLIVTEGMSVHRSSRPHPSVITAYHPDALPGLTKLAGRVRRHGASVLMQLWHVGRQMMWGPRGEPWGLSATPDSLSRVVPHVMSTSEVEEVVAGYVETALNAERAGFSGVEIHAAHGYLITQSLSALSNSRSDKYGGSFKAKTTLLNEILDGIRARCGSDFIVALKLTGSELVNGGMTVEDSRAVAAQLVESGLIDLITVAQGNFSLSLDNHVPDLTFPAAPYRDLLRRVRDSARPVPFMAVGKIDSRELADDILESDDADLIGLARPLISDPDLPVKWQGINSGAVRECIFCNYCWDATRANSPIDCIQNSDVIYGSPAEAGLATSGHLKVDVIGGGPAGLEVAWRAAARGHAVTIWEASDILGGQVNSLASASSLSDYGKLVRFQIDQATRWNVTVKTGCAMDAQALGSLTTDRLVIATGAVPQEPWFESDNSASLMTPFDIDNEFDTVPPAGGVAVIIDDDGGLYAYSPLRKLVELGWNVILVSAVDELAMKLGVLSKMGFIKLLRNADVKVIRGYRPTRLSDGDLYIQDTVSTDLANEERRPEQAIEAVSLLVWAGARMANDALVSGLLSKANNSIVIGDARSPRDITSAIKEGKQCAENLELQ